ncbi:exonuclease subunit SbcD [Affinibrenneria salicis]|uniref:Nuclease SbcCD subunit D n=1 Tax=Affinibrenneria salicis TaxID=2590031 RepID=A0A5J5FS32_9GAMM|nr:exonuclease subunit SbcD [Affinibrenneria salicis]KAA8996179.1 exonuclease subunit SbcD [Affinibrenneria salicis]
MRIIHTADWHLGQHFYTKSRAAEHQAFLDWLIDQAQRHLADAIIVAGDIFDTGSPPSYAREMYNRFVVSLQQTGCRLVVLAGNHDSVATLNESRELLACLNVTVLASASDDTEQQVLVLPDRRGQPGAILCAVPFLRPRDLTISHAGQSGGEKQQALLEAIARYYQHLHQAALHVRATLDLPLPIIATGHLTAVGASTSDSVRDIYIGTLDAFPAQAFPPADYIALGHIHRAQTVAKSEHIRYSGSPIALSFDELNKDKSVYLVEFTRQTLSRVEALPVPVLQPMALLRGSLAEIEQQLAAFRRHEGEHPVWLDIEITTEHWLSDIQRQVEQLCADLPVEVLLLRRSKERREQNLARQDKETLNELSVQEVFDRRLALEIAPDDVQRQRLRQLFGQVTEQIVQQGGPHA